MGRFKVKKTDTHIDMTPMSDVMVLLLTFFMLTATFVKPEPIKVQVPGSVSEIKIPETNILTIYVSNAGKVFFTMDSEPRLASVLDQMETQGAITGLTAEQKAAFSQTPTFGVPISMMKSYLSNPEEKRIELLSDAAAGIPTDSANDELKIWVKAAREACGTDMGIAIKADATTSYAVIKKVMDSLRSIRENKYNLITSLKNADV